MRSVVAQSMGTVHWFTLACLEQISASVWLWVASVHELEATQDTAPAKLVHLWHLVER